MGALQVRIEPDRPPRAVERETERDVLELVIPFEPAQGLEVGAPDRAQTGPEARNVPARVLVHVVVQQVARPTEASRSRRRIVVAADDAGMSGMAGEEVLQPLPGAGVNSDVGVDEEHDGGPARRSGAVARLGRAPRDIRGYDARPERRSQFRGVVGRSVVRYDHLVRSEARTAQRLEALR